MFSFFKKKNPAFTVTDRVWMSEAAKWKAIKEMMLADPDTILVCWFDETFRKAESVFEATGGRPVVIQTAREIARTGPGAARFLFAEHYPLREKEEELFRRLGISAALVCSSLEEPLFSHFGSAKLITVMQKMGMQEWERIEHPLVTSSIRNAQDKIAKKAGPEQSAASQADWFRKNFIP